MNDNMSVEEGKRNLNIPTSILYPWCFGMKNVSVDHNNVKTKNYPPNEMS